MFPEVGSVRAVFQTVLSVLGSPLKLPSDDFIMGSPEAIFASDSSVLPPLESAPQAPALQDVPAP
eukprot:6814011-Alexandrium_andersonii.AAC.1